MRKRVRSIAFVAAMFGMVLLVACGGGGGGGHTTPVNGALTILPGSPSVPVGQSVQFTAYLDNTATSSSWTASAGWKAP